MPCLNRAEILICHGTSIVRFCDRLHWVLNKQKLLVGTLLHCVVVCIAKLGKQKLCVVSVSLSLQEGSVPFFISHERETIPKVVIIKSWVRTLLR